MIMSSAGVARVLELAPAQSTADQLLGALSTVLRGRVAAYVSTPITTGPALLAWRRGLGRSHRPGSAAHGAFVEQMIAENTARARPLVAVLEDHLGVPVIDPTRLGQIPGWEQRDYHEFWVQVIRNFVHTVVFADGWQFSTGCTLEFESAVTENLTVMDARMQPLDESIGGALLGDAIVELEASGLDASVQRRVSQQLARIRTPE